MNRRTAQLWWIAATLAGAVSFAVAAEFGGRGIRWISFLLTVGLAITGAVLLRRSTRTLQRIHRILDDDAPAEVFPTDREQERALDRSLTRRQESMHAAATALEVERVRLDSILDEVRIGLIVVDPDQRIRHANRLACRIFDLGAEPKGQSLTQVIRDPSILSIVERQFETSATTNSVDERNPAEVHIEKLTDRGRSFEVFVSKMRGSDRSLRVLIQLYEISRLERLETVRRDFVANVSHELRTPLTSIQAAAETLDDPKIAPAEARKFVEMIQRQSTRMSELIEDLIDLAQIETGAIELDLESIDIQALTDHVLNQLRPLAERLEVKLDNRVVAGSRILADRRRLEQVLTNLSQNAVKYNRPGGYVRVEAAEQEVRISDSGIGIPSNAQDRIFNRFYQVENARTRAVAGTGLGLAIVKHLMSLHGGSILVESELGRGSVFTLRFPDSTLKT